MKNKLIILFFIFGFWRLNATETAFPKTNFDIFTEMSTQCLQAFLDANLSGNIKKVTLESIDPADSLNWLVENSLFNLLRQREVDSIRIQSATGGETFGSKDKILIKFKIINLALRYETESRWRINGKSNITRQFDFQLFLQIIDPQNKTLLWSGQSSRQYSDRVSQNQIARLESSSMQFTRARLQSRRVYSRFIEPFLVLSTTGAIIYLFYSFRSQ
jgi:hypothetical protein